MANELSTPLTKKEVAAMREFKQAIARGFCMGRRRIVSMQGLHAAGLVKPICNSGLITDWQITEAGKNWND